MTKDDLEMNNDNEISTKKEEYDPSSDLGLFLMNNLLGPYANFFSGTLLFIMYLYQNYNYEGSSIFSIRFWALLVIGEIILVFSLGLLTGIFSYAIAFICETLIPLFFKKIETVKNIKVSSLLVLTVSSLVILVFITWKFSYYSFSYTYGNFSLGDILKVAISDQEILYPPDGSIYIGQTLDEKPHGLGRYFRADGRTYVGEWKNGVPNGQGTLTLSDGVKYVGEFKNGFFHGEGTLNFGDDTYQGEFKNGRRSGHGTYIYSDGRKYVGEWKNDKINGQGKITLSDGWSNYEGEWKDSKKHGQGIFMLRVLGKEFKAEGFFKDGMKWDVTTYDENGEIVGKTVNGEKIEQ